jgi:hypothetical protein
LFVKAFAGIVIGLVLILIAGLSGFSFRVWPTGFNDYKLSVTPEVLQRLSSFQSERKFGPDSAIFDTAESEERDQVLVYLSKIMEICGVHSSAELFNVWRYGFPYGWLF